MVGRGNLNSRFNLIHSSDGWNIAQLCLIFSFLLKNKLKGSKLKSSYSYTKKERLVQKKKQRSVALPVVLISCEKSLVACKELP